MAAKIHRVSQRSRKESLREKFPDITNLTNLDVKPLYPLWRIYQVTSMLRAARIILGFPEGGQCAPVRFRLGKVTGMLLEDQEHFIANVAAFPAELVVHPESLTADINPAAALEVGQVARHRGLGQFEHRNQVADAQFPLGLQQEDDAQADRVGEGFQGLREMFHGYT